MRVPRLAGHEQLHETHATLHQPPRHQAAQPVRPRLRLVEAVQAVRLRRLLGQLRQLRYPRLELRPGVQVPELLVDVLAGPLVAVPVEPHHREVAGRGEHRRDRALVPLGHVHADVRQVVLAQEIQRLRLVVTGEPALVPQFHRDPQRAAPLGDLQQVLLVGAADGEPGRELEQDGTELSGRHQRIQRGQEPGPHVLVRLRGQVVGGRCCASRSPAAGPCRSPTPWSGVRSVG